MTKDENNSKQTDMKKIPESEQDISTEEVVEQDYNVVQSSEQQPNEDKIDTRQPPRHTAIEPPGRTRHSDSIEASSDNVGGDPQGHEYSAGYDSQMATRIGDEESSNEGDRLRTLHEGRHRSDGRHSLRESQRDKRRIAQATCSDLPLTTREQEEVVHIVEQLNLDRFGNQKAIERVVLGVVVVVVDEEHRQTLANPELVQWSDEFKRMRKNREVSMSDLSTIKQKIRELTEGGEIHVGPERPRRDPALPDPTSIEERPDGFWKSFTAEDITNMARRWGDAPGEWKQGIPEEFRKRINLLRRWEPWTDEEETE